MHDQASLSDEAAALALAIKEAGGRKAVGSHFGITPQAVGQWDRCPANRAAELERLSGGKVPRWRLRPDIFPPPTAERSAA